MARAEHLTGPHVSDPPASLAALLTELSLASPVPAVLPSVRTGFEVLDDVLDGGFRPGDLVLVGGAPGVGKTVTTLQWARNIATAGRPAVYVCYEHDVRTLFARLLLLEVGELPGRVIGTDRRLRRIVRGIARGELSIEAEAGAELRLRTAHARLAAYAPSLSLVRGSAQTRLEELAAAVHRLGDGAVLFVDYLQKVPGSGAGEEERIIAVGHGLKDLAMSTGSVVVAVAAGDRPGLVERRLRPHHLRGAASLAYEADVIILLNDKFHVVSKAHTAFDAVRAERFKEQVVFTVEKNRDGPAPVDVEFVKDFGHYRFVPTGSAVEERLIDDRLIYE